MKTRYKIALVLMALCLALVLFRESIYRACIRYESVGQRKPYPISDSLLLQDMANNFPTKPHTDVADIVDGALRFTSSALWFTTKPGAEVNPNRLIHTHQTHCVGYAQFFAAVCNRQLQQNGLGNAWEAQVRVGKLYFLGINLHQYLDSPFFRDHDFVLLKNTATGEEWAVDPTVHDYLGIVCVALKK